VDLTILDSGRTASLNSGVPGIKIEIGSFTLGSAFGYAVNPATDTALHGAVLYTGTPIGYSVIDADTCEFMLQVPGNVGTFNFGEVGLHLVSGALYAVGVLPGLQQKIAAPGTGWNTINIRARLHESGLPATITFVIQEITAGAIIELPNWSTLNRPADAPSNVYIVHDADDLGNDALVTRSHDGTWDVSTHGYPVVEAGAFTVGPGATGSALLASGVLPMEASFPLGRYLIQPKTGAQAGNIRKVTSVSGSVLHWSPSFGAPLDTGDEFEILQSTASLSETVGTDIALFHALATRSFS